MSKSIFLEPDCWWWRQEGRKKNQMNGHGRKEERMDGWGVRDRFFHQTIYLTATHARTYVTGWISSLGVLFEEG